jgi:DNA-binding NarL/FixJ family response regulator
LLVDDHSVLRQGCRLLFEQAGLHVVGEAASGEDAYQQCAVLAPTVVVIDLTMDGMGGLETLRRMRGRWPDLGVVIFTMHDDPVIATRVLRTGAQAYVTKTSAPAALIEAVKRAAAGDFFLSQDVAQTIALSNLDAGENPLTTLTPREFEIFRMLGDGRSHAEIAGALSLTQKSVTNYYLRIKLKLGARSIADIVRLAIINGIVKRNVETL